MSLIPDSPILKGALALMRAVTTESLHNARRAMADLGLIRRCRALNAWAVLVPLLASCSIGTGIQDFGNDVTNQPRITFGASHQLVKGQYTSPIVDPWDDRGPVIIAFVYINGAPHLGMRPEDGTTGCDTDVAYSSVVRDKLPNRVQLVAYRGPAEPGKPGTEPLAFVDHDCHAYGPPIIGGSLPELLYPEPPGYLAKVVINPETTPVTQYWVVDPWNATTRVLASNVSWYSLLDKKQQVIGVVDDGHLRVFDTQQQLLGDVGTAVQEVLFVSGWSGPFYAVDAGVLRRYQSMSDTAPVKIAEDVCSVSQDGSSAIFYFSPCNSRQLQRYQLQSGQTTIIDTGVGAIVSTRPKAGSVTPYVLYTKAGAQSGQDLWLYAPDAAPALVLSNFSRMYDWTPPPELDIMAMVNSNSATGSIIRHNASVDKTVLDSVSVKFSQGILANFDTETSVGELYYPLQLSSEPELAATGVPFVDQVNSIVSPPPDSPDVVPYGSAASSAAITNATAGVGDLTLMRLPSPTSPGPDQPVTLASGVPVGRFGFFESMVGVAYIENWDRTLQQGHLAFRELTLDARTDISDEVRDFQEVKWPSPGIMYVIWNGDRAGIWVAKAK